MATVKKKRNVALALAAVVIVAVGLLSWALGEPANAKPGYTCNPPAGHGNPGCHVTATTSTPTTKRPTTTTTKRPATTTTKRPATTTTRGPATTTITASTTGTEASTTTLPVSTDTSQDSTTSVVERSTTTLGPTTSVLESTTTTDDLGAVAAVAGSSGGGGGGSGGWIALLTAVGILAVAGWAVAAIKWAGSRRTSVGRGAVTGGPLRFVLAERLGHWFYAFCFLAAGVTGVLMWIPSTAQSMAGAYFTVARYHGYLGLALVIVPLSIFLLLDRRRLVEDRRALDQWDANDRRWLRLALAGGLFRGKKMPPQGRFNAGQKLNSLLVVALTLGFAVTGSLLIAKGHLPFWLTSGVLFSHKVLAVTGGALLVGHVGMAVLTPHGRGGLKAMVKGILPAHVAQEGHSIWYAEWLKHDRRDEVGLVVGDEAGRSAPATPSSA